MTTRPDGDPNAPLVDQLRQLREYMEQTFEQVNNRVDHFVGHDRAFPTEGCEYCEVRGAA